MNPSIHQDQTFSLHSAVRLSCHPEVGLPATHVDYLLYTTRRWASCQSELGVCPLGVGLSSYTTQRWGFLPLRSGLDIFCHPEVGLSLIYHPEVDLCHSEVDLPLVHHLEVGLCHPKVGLPLTYHPEVGFLATLKWTGLFNTTRRWAFATRKWAFLPLGSMLYS